MSTVTNRYVRRFEGTAADEFGSTRRRMELVSEAMAESSVQLNVLKFGVIGQRKAVA